MQHSLFYKHKTRIIIFKDHGLKENDKYILIMLFLKIALNLSRVSHNSSSRLKDFKKEKTIDKRMYFCVILCTFFHAEKY